MSVKNYEDWVSSYNEEFHLAIDAAIKFAMTEDLQCVANVFSKFRVKRDSNAGIIARIIRLIIHIRYREENSEYRELVLKDASELLEDLSNSHFSEYDANLLATVIIRKIKGDEEIFLKTLEQRLKFAGAKFEILLIHPKIKEFASKADEGLAGMWK